AGRPGRERPSYAVRHHGPAEPVPAGQGRQGGEPHGADQQPGGRGEEAAQVKPPATEAYQPEARARDISPRLRVGLVRFVVATYGLLLAALSFHTATWLPR